MISTVDPEARHGHKTAARGFDGYKGHVGIDPDSEIITDTKVSAGNAGDASVAEDLISDLLAETETAEADAEPAETETVEVEVEAEVEVEVEVEAETEADDDVAADAETEHAEAAEAAEAGEAGADGASVYGDNAYGTGEFHDRLGRAGIDDKCKSQQPVAAGGLFTKNRFEIDLDADTVGCPAGHTAPIRRADNGAGIARFGQLCANCPLREQCTRSEAGRSVHVGVYERQLAAARKRQREPGWVADYRATRPKVERKIGHLMRRRHGGRRARMRGKMKIAADFALLAAAVNLARMATLAVVSTPGRGWATATR